MYSNLGGALQANLIHLDTMAFPQNLTATSFLLLPPDLHVTPTAEGIDAGTEPQELQLSEPGLPKAFSL